MDAPHSPQNLTPSALQAALNTMIDGVQIVGWDWRYLYVNAAFAAQFGVPSPRDWVGRTMQDCMAGFDLSPLSQAIEKCMAQRSHHRVQEQLDFLPDSPCFEVHIDPIEAGVVIRTRDITSIALTEEEYLLQINELQRSNDALQQYAFVAAHDLKSPLRHLFQFVEMMESEFDCAEIPTASSYIERIGTTARRMHALVDDLLAFATIQQTKADRVTVDLRDSVDAVMAILSSLPESERVVVSVGALPVVRSHQGGLRLVLQNVIENAIKFSSSSESPHVEIKASEDQEHWYVEVVDNGTGFSSDLLDQSFQAFRRGQHSRSIPGQGIGLVSCQRILDVIGGTLRVANLQSGGGQVTIMLPKPLSDDVSIDRAA